MAGILRPSSPPKVLLAEDNPVNAVVISKQLQVLGYACIVAEDGEQAWAALQVARYVALLTDCEMPNLDGYALARRIRAAPSFAGLPIIALSARPDAAQQARCRDAGMDACLPKPIPNADLVDALAAAGLRYTHDPRVRANSDLDALLTLFPNPQTLAPLLSQFLATAAIDLEELDRWHAAARPEAFGRLLHRFVGSLQMLNQHDIAGELDGWHRSRRMPSASDYAALRSRLVGVVERVHAWLHRLEA